MAKFRRTTPETVVADMHAFADFLARSGEFDRKVAAGDLNTVLDEWHSNNAFGTEGQCDPRGDHRG